jgi:ankyrin repeat protein
MSGGREEDKRQRISIDRENKQYIDLNNQGQDQWTLLHIATNEGNFEIVKILLENEANPNSQSVNQRTSLHIACMRGYPIIVKELLDFHADIDIADMDGNTPAHLCSEFGKI